MDRQLEGKAVLVMGPWSASMHATAALMAGHGARLLVVSPSRHAARTTVEAIRAQGGAIRLVDGSLWESGSMGRRAIAETIRASNVDVLCLSPLTVPATEPRGEPAGVSDPVSVPDLRSIVHTLMVCLPGMIRRRAGTIILNASDGALWAGFEGEEQTLAIQHFMDTYVGLLAASLLDYDVTVNAIVPSGRRCPARTLARALTFLASDAAGEMTGQVVNLVRVEAPEPGDPPPQATRSAWDFVSPRIICADLVNDFDLHLN